MGRALEMESKLDHVEARLKKAEDALAKVIEVVDTMQEKTSKVKPVNLTGKKASPKKEKKNASKEKADNKGDGKGNK